MPKRLVAVPAAKPAAAPVARPVAVPVATAAAGGLMTGMALKPTKVKSPKPRSYSENPGTLTFLFWIAIILHIFYALIRSDILGSGAQSLLPFTRVFYGALALMAILVFTRLYGFDFVTLLICVGISAFYVFIPYINIPALSLGAITLPSILSFLILIVPIWPLYISTKGDFPIMSGYITIWIVFLVALFFYKVIFEVSPYDLGPLTGSQQASQAGQVFSFLADETHKVGDKIVNSIFGLADTIQNRTGINFYMGMIEDNKEEPVGLYINKVWPADKYFYEGSPILIWTDIRGKSLVKESEITVTPSCYIDGKGYAQTVEPNVFHLLGEETNSFLCTFSDLPKGTYRVKANAAFNFETWAYVTYTFVDIEMKRSYELQNKIINSELNIPLKPKAVYTNGPIMLGMGTGLDQPIGIDTQYNTREPILGVTIENQWTDGQIEGPPSEFVIQVPDDFDLVKCDRGTPQTSEGIVSGYTAYTFRKENLPDPRLGFQSITCRLRIKDSLLKTFLIGAPKVQKTFVAKVSYLYNLQKSVSINVRE